MIKKNDENGSLGAHSLRYKLVVSFFLVVVLPLLVCVYLVLPRVDLKIDITVILIASVLVAIAGFFIIKEVFDRVAIVTQEAKKIALGGDAHGLETKPMDEVGELSDALNILMQNMRENMNELSGYGEKTTQINFEIQKRVMMFSNLLQVSSLITQGAKIDDILKAITEKSLLLTYSEVSYLLYRAEKEEIFSVRISVGAGGEYLLNIKVGSEDDLFAGAIKNNKLLIVDANNALAQKESLAFQEKFKLKSMMALPIWLRGRVVAILGVGNNDKSFVYTKEDIERLDIFTKQVAIAIENNFLVNRVEKLEVKDALTGLYNGPFMYNRLQEEIKRSITYQRPCAYILFEVDNFKKINQKFGSLQAEGVLKRIAALIKGSVTDIDHVGRIGDSEFAVLLPEKNKRQVQLIAEGITKKIALAWSQERDINKRFSVSAGVTENPFDGMNADELTAKARDLLAIAKGRGGNCVVGFIGKV